MYMCRDLRSMEDTWDCNFLDTVSPLTSVERPLPLEHCLGRVGSGWSWHGWQSHLQTSPAGSLTSKPWRSDVRECQRQLLSMRRVWINNVILMATWTSIRIGVEVLLLLVFYNPQARIGGIGITHMATHSNATCEQPSLVYLGVIGPYRDPCLRQMPRSRWLLHHWQIPDSIRSIQWGTQPQTQLDGLILAPMTDAVCVRTKNAALDTATLRYKNFALIVLFIPN